MLPDEKLSDGSSSSEALAPLIKEAQGNAAQKGISVSQLTVDNTNFNLELSDQCNVLFEKTVNAAQNLTTSQKATLIFMYYNPGVTPPGIDLSALQGYQNRVLQQASQKFGFSSTYCQPPNKHSV